MPASATTPKTAPDCTKPTSTTTSDPANAANTAPAPTDALTIVSDRPNVNPAATSAPLNNNNQNNDDILSTILQVINVRFDETNARHDKTNARFNALKEDSTHLENRLNARLDALSANTTNVEHRLNNRIDTVSDRITQMTDNMVTNILATTMPQAIAKVNLYITSINKDAIDKKINVAIKNGFNHRITRKMDYGIWDSIAEDGRIHR